MLQLLGQKRLKNARSRNRHVERAEGRGFVFDVVEHKTPAWSESKRIGGASTHFGAPPAVGAPAFAQPFV